MARTNFSSFSFDQRFQQLPDGKGISDDEVRVLLENRDQQVEDYLAGLSKAVFAEFRSGGRPIYATTALRDSDTRTKVAGALSYVTATDTEYLWDGSTWVTWNHPVVGVPAAFTYTVVQTGTLTMQSTSPTRAKYRVSNGQTSLEGLLIVSSGTGTSGVRIEVTLTGPTASIAANSGFPLGVGYVLDSGTSQYACTVHQISASPFKICFLYANSAAFVGQAPAFGLAVSDQLNFNLNYFSR